MNKYLSVSFFVASVSGMHVQVFDTHNIIFKLSINLERY